MTALTYTTAMTADVTELASLLGIGVATAAADQRGRALKLAQNHGFLKGLMMRVGKHFQAAGSGAWRVLSSGGVWFSLLSACVSAVMLLFQARDLRHYKQQPTLGKLRVLGVGAAFGAFIMNFLGFFKKIAMAWKNESDDDLEKRKAANLLSRLDAAERAALMARSQAAHASIGEHTMPTPALAMLATALTAQGAVIDTHVAEAGVDEQITKAKAALVHAFKLGIDAVESLVRKALDLATKHPRVATYGLIIATFYVYALRKGNKTLQRSALARDPKSLKRAQEIFENLRRQRANISPAVYTEITRARDLVGKALVAA